MIAPNLMRILAVGEMTDNTSVLELGCGQGYFLSAILDHLPKGVSPRLEGVDLGAELLEMAGKRLGDKVTLTTADASQLSHVKDGSVDSLYAVLALQKMSDLDAVIGEVARVLSVTGRFVAILNHPAFRVPKQSDWHISAEKKSQGRVVYTYMSDKKFAIDMHPGQSALGKKSTETFSFHHPLQYYTKTLAKHGLCIARLEEWISHKVSEEGPKKRMEDESRKEIPMFMCLDIRHLQSGKSL